MHAFAPFLATLSTPSVASDGPDLTRYLVVCAGLIGGIALVGYGLKRLVGRSALVRAEKRSLRVIDVLPLGGKHKLAVVRCYDRTFVLGLGEKEVGLVAELDRELEPASVPAVQPRTKLGLDFKHWLERLGAPNPRPASAASDTLAVASAQALPSASTLGDGKGILV